MQAGKLYVGVMSGTSLDGVDLVLARISGPPFAHQILALDYRPFQASFRQQLQTLLAANSLPPELILGAHVALGRFFANSIQAFLKAHQIEPTQVVAIGLHGITLQHRPEGCHALGMRVSGSWQLGDAHTVRQQLGISTISDFRAADMALGGQGAPLVPFLDQLLFAHPQEHRILLNLGGIANLTFLCPTQPLVAFDSGPANMVIDALIADHTSQPNPYDSGGKLAAQGRVLPKILDACLGHPYFAAPPPKSTGRELFGQSFTRSHFQSKGALLENLLATATRLTARTVADAIKGRACSALMEDHVLICSGGGVHNHTLMEMLEQELVGMKISTTADYGLNEDAKEALLMAVLAWAHLHGISGNLPEVTGASHAAVLGARC